MSEHDASHPQEQTLAPTLPEKGSSTHQKAASADTTSVVQKKPTQLTQEQLIGLIAVFVSVFGSAAQILTGSGAFSLLSSAIGLIFLIALFIYSRSIDISPWHRLLISTTWALCVVLVIGIFFNNLYPRIISELFKLSLADLLLFIIWLGLSGIFFRLRPWKWLPEKK